MKRYPQYDTDADYKRRLGDAARAALQRREVQRLWREAQDALDDTPGRDEIQAVIAEHYSGVDEVMRGRT